MSFDLQDLYQDVILDHSRSPRNFRELEEARSAMGNNPMCGDRFTVYLDLDETGKVADISFLGNGCAISTASASMMTELIKGKSRHEVSDLFDHFHKMCTSEVPPDGANIDAEDQEKLMVLSGVREYPMRVKCATLAWHTMRAALDGAEAATTE